MILFVTCEKKVVWPDALFIRTTYQEMQSRLIATLNGILSPELRFQQFLFDTIHLLGLDQIWEYIKLSTS